MKVSIIIPVYNEKATIKTILESVKNAPLSGQEREVVVVDDCSSDGTSAFLRQMKPSGGVKILFHEKNMGKGAALRTGFKNATGDIIIIQDADLEYDPQEYPRLIDPILQGKADVVYGSRFMGGEPHRVLYFWHSLANSFLTFMSNAFSDLNLTDMETCYKVFRKSVVEDLHIEENRFGFEPEITAKLGALTSEKGIRVYEVGISYYGRTYEDGKKIGWKDALWTFWCIFKYNTSGFAHFVKYLVNGTIVALSYFLLLIAMVEMLGMKNIAMQNVANIASSTISLLLAFFLHSSLTWRQKYAGAADRFNSLIRFLIASTLSTMIRFFAFYMFSLVGMGYRLNGFISIIIIVAFNFVFYDKFVFFIVPRKIRNRLK